MRGNLYRCINNHHAEIVQAVETGITVGDLINREAAACLKAELNSRFGLLDKYLCNHHNANHASGDEIFGDAGRCPAVANSRAGSIHNRESKTVRYGSTLPVTCSYRDEMIAGIGS